jgi:choline dehydrogenase-like flavoprotein
MPAHDYDVCVIGSGAGGGPIAYELALAGYRVAVMEKGRWITNEQFFKDEIAAVRRSYYTPNLKDEFHVIEEEYTDGSWRGESTYDSGWDFWNGNMVGGATNLMSGYFHRMKPVDFRLLSEFGAIEGANVVDWPLDYATMEPYFDKVERVIGVSGKVVPHKHLEPRSNPDFPYPPLFENTVAKWLDKSCQNLGYEMIPTPRAILPTSALGRTGCSYSDYCGSYGCATGAKGSSRVALLDHAVQTGKCTIYSECQVHRLLSDHSGKVYAAEYSSKDNEKKEIRAKIFVVACHAIESNRLLLLSNSLKHPNGLGNHNGQLGKNLLFSGGGSGSGTLPFVNLSETDQKRLKQRGFFVNRAIQEWYVIDDQAFGQPAKGGTIDFLFRHSNPMAKANQTKWDSDGNLQWGLPLKRAMEKTFTEARYLRYEIFNDWLPNDNCFVQLDPVKKDKWGYPVARFRIGYHPQDINVGKYLNSKAENVLRQLGAVDISSGVSGSPPANLVAGGCRFGNDADTSVLDPDCRMHSAENVFVTDGSFMPTGGSVPYTWTIYANSFRVAEKIIAQL